jgi:hypothetical protein
MSKIIKSVVDSLNGLARAGVMSGRKVAVPGYVWKDGKLVKRPTKMSASEKKRQPKSKRVRVVRGRR